MLKEIWEKYWTDKFVHWYLDFYENIFKDINIERLLEIGIHQWASLKMWKEYLPNADIYWVDIVATDKIDWCTQYLADATTKEFANMITNMDVILDDWWHLTSQQKESFRLLFPKVNEWWVYIVEDIQTSFIPSYMDSGSSYDYIKEYAKENWHKTEEFWRTPDKTCSWTLVIYK